MVEKAGVSREARDELCDAYLEAKYKIALPKGWITVQPGKKTLEFDAYLESRGVVEWAFVTAANPRSERLCPQENEVRHQLLRKRVGELGLPFLDAVGEGDESWPAEVGVAVLGIGRDGAVMLGREFDQNAILHGTRDQAVRLVWCGGKVEEK